MVDEDFLNKLVAFGLVDLCDELLLKLDDLVFGCLHSSCQAVGQPHAVEFDLFRGQGWGRIRVEVFIHRLGDGVEGAHLWGIMEIRVREW